MAHARSNHHHSHHTHPLPVTGKPTRREFISSLVAAAVLAPWALGQTQTQSSSDTAERFRQMSEDYESKGLATPFKGITTNGEVVPGLFETKPSGVSPNLCAMPRKPSSQRSRPSNSPEPWIPWTTSSGANG